MFSSLPLFNIISSPFKRAQLGLFHGKNKQSGNNVPFSKHKTRRSWLPNVHNKRFFSEAMQEFVRVKVSTKALKTINKHGGIDQYVLRTKPELLGHEGMRIRVMVREKLGDKAAQLAKTPIRPVKRLQSSSSSAVPPSPPSSATPSAEAAVPSAPSSFL